MGDVDIALRQVATRHPEDLARLFVPPGTPILSMRWLDTQLAARERRADKGLLVQLATHRLAIHNEWFIDVDADMAWRMYEYGCQLQEAVRQEDAARAAAAKKRAKSDPQAPPYVAPARLYVQACAVVLDGPDTPLPTRGAWWISPPDAPADEESVARFRIEAVYQRTTAELLAHPGVLWLVFAPLARDASETTLRLAVQAARERAQSREELEDLASAMQVLATARPRGPTLTARMIDMFKEEGLIERTWLFQHGVEKGIEKGIEKGREEGREQGREEAAAVLREGLLGTLRDRGLRLSPAQRQRIAQMHDLATLSVWGRAAVTARTAAQALAAMPATK